MLIKVVERLKDSRELDISLRNAIIDFDTIMETIVQPEQNSDSDDPPDSILTSKNRLFLKEPKNICGSFLVPEKELFILEAVSDIKKCQFLWQEFSPNQNLFDTWEFRYAFYKGYNFNPFFLLLKRRDENLALLPLWFDEDKKKYTWFGSDWQEEVSFFARDIGLIPTLLSAAPSPLHLNAISKESVKALIGKVNFQDDCPKYILELNDFRNHEDFLMTLKKNRRHDLRKDRRRIERQGPEIIINNFADMEKLIALARARFKEKGEETDWEDPRRVETFKEIINLSGQSYKTRMITIRISGQAAGVDLICLFNNTYLAVKCGYNVSDFPGIGNFMNLIEIDDAIKLGMKKIDFLQNNYAWKDRWFKSVLLVKYEK